jgi:hypothetical protein
MFKGLGEAKAIEIGHHRNATKATLGKLPPSLSLQHFLEAVSGWQ